MSRFLNKIKTNKAKRNAVAAVMAISLMFMQMPVSWAVAGAGADATAVTPQTTTEVDQGAVREIGVRFDHAYIVYTDQVLSAPATKMTVPEGADIEFQVKADEGYKVASVMLESAGEEKRLEADADGNYKVSASALTADAIIEVAATEAGNSSTTADANAGLAAQGAVDVASAEVPEEEGSASTAAGSGTGLSAQGAATSNDLADFLKDASVSAPKNDKGEYVIAPGTSYSISLSFAENPSLQFPNDGSTMAYRLPEGLHVADGDSGQLTIKVNDGGVVHDIPGNTYRIDDGVLYFNFNTAHENFSKLAAAANARFNVTFTGSFVEGAHGVTFKDGVSRDFEVDNTNSVTVSKAASFDKANGVVNYTVSVCSKGISKNVVVKDVVKGDVLTLDPDSIRATSSTGEAVVLDGQVSGNSFEYTIPQMRNDEVVEIKYSAKVDPTKIVGVDGKYEATADNTVEVKSDGDPDPDEASTTTTIDYTPTIKKTNAELIAENGNVKTMRWTVTANGDALVSMAGDTITDTIADDSKDFTKYSGVGIKVEVFDANGTRVRTDEVAWGDLASKSDSSWTYKVPESDRGQAYKYVITYETEADLTGKTSITTVSNGVATGGGRSDSGSGQGVPAGGEVKVYKNVEKVDIENREISWTISFNVPESGLNSAVVTDTYPNKWFNGKHFVELVKDGSVEVTGLGEGETYDINYGKSAATITFYKDADKKSQGLKEGSERIVTIRLKTEISDGMMEAALSNSWYQFHVNSVSLKANGEEKKAEAKAAVIEPAVTKKVTQVGSRVVDGVELPVYKYEVILSNVTSDVNVIDDVYDTSLLMPYSYNSYYAYRIYAGDTYSQSVRGGTFSYKSTDTGMRFTTSADAMPHTTSTPTGFYDKYKLVYYLTVRDEAALNTIIANAAATEDGKFAIGNSATWGELTGEAHVDYEYKGLKKELMTPDEDLKKTDEDIWAEFRITLNPGSQTLNGGEPLTMTDTFNNLSIDFESIKATPAEGVTWDVSDNVVTYTIPDKTKVVITYKARVVVKDNGEPGDTVRVNFSNVAEMSGYKDGVNKTAERHNSGNGAASVPSIKLMKYEAGNMKNKLSGATFALLDEDKNPVVDDDGPVTFTTDDDGMITVRGDQEQLGWVLAENTRYYLREMTAPKGYMLASSDFAFQISDDGTTDYDRFIYHTGDTLMAKNYPGTDVKVVKVWSDGNSRHAPDTVTVKLQQKIGEGDWSDAVRMEVKNDAGQHEWRDVPSMTATMSGETDWATTFTGLPLAVPASLGDASSDDVAVSYRVVETAVNGGAPKEGAVQIVEGEDGGSRLFTITNTVDHNYNVKGSATFRATKVLSGRDLKSGEFQFVLEENGTELQRVYNVGNDVVFDPIVYHSVESELGEHTYTIREVQPAGDAAAKGVTYDDSSYTVKVTVTDEGGDTLNVTYGNGYDPDKGVTFSNSYEAEAKAQLFALKTMTGRAMQEGEFTFVLTGDKIADRYRVPMKLQEDGTGRVDFPAITFTQDDAGKDFKFQITEVNDGKGGVAYDAHTEEVTIHVADNGDGTLALAYNGNATFEGAAFANKYEAKSAEVQLEASKVLAGGEVEDGQFAFTLAGASDNTQGVSQVKKNGADGKVVFDTITYDEPGTYEYTITENVPQGAIDNHDGTYRVGTIVYDGEEHTAVVKVTDNGEGQLVAQVTYDGAKKLVVTNGIQLPKVGFEFTKYCFGTTGDFKFKLTAVDEEGTVRSGDVKEYGINDEVVDNKTDAFSITVSNGAFAGGSAKVVFPEISFAEDGDYYYLVSEVEQDTPGMVTDEAMYLVHVTAANGEVLSTTYELIYDGENCGPTTDLSFYNNAAVKLGFASLSAQSYTDAAQKTSAYPEVKKYLNGSSDLLVGGDFEFELVDAQTGAVVARATNDENGRVAFFDEENEDGLVFTEAGTYRYLIREIAGDDSSIIYDTSVITLTVNVSDTGDGLHAELVYGGAVAAGEEPAFYNNVEGMDLTVRKVSRYGGEGLVDCTYALWMVGANGDVMVQEATSDANGFITFEDVSLIHGARYYFKEVEAPAGHTVDPYRTAYFSLNEDGTDLVLVEETAADGWHSKYDNIELDKERKANGRNE